VLALPFRLVLAPRLQAVPALVAALALALPAGATASASEVTKIYEACGNNMVPTGYSQQTYAQAIREMEPFLAEYTNCPDLIRKAQLARAAGTGAPGAGAAGGPSRAPTPAEQHTLESIPRASAPPVRVGGQVVHPGVVRVNLASAFSTLPAPLLALLAFMLACALLLAGRVLRNRVRTRNHGN